MRGKKITIMICGDGETAGMWEQKTLPITELNAKVQSGEWRACKECQYGDGIPTYHFKD